MEHGLNAHVKFIGKPCLTLNLYILAERIEYKVALLTFKDMTTGTPDYLSDQLQLCAPVRQLRSSDRKTRLEAYTSIAIGQR